MTHPAIHSGRSRHRPALAAAVGLGSITLDAVLVAPNRTLRVGGGPTCDLPFTCDPADLVERVDGAWIVRLPDGVDRDGPDGGTRTIRLCDWDAGVTLRGHGDSWLRLWPTRPERFSGRDRLAGPRWLLSRALPVLWIAASVTLGLATFGLWASTAVRGDLHVLSLGDGALGQGGDLERVASLGDGEQAAGATLGAWVSQPTPLAPAPEDDTDETDAVVDEAPVADDESEAEPPATASDDAPRPEADDNATAARPPIEEEAGETRDAPADDTPDTASDEHGNEDSSPAATGDGDASATGDDRGTKGRKAGGAGGFGLGGGTDDGYADRMDSVNALERSLLGCLDGDETHRINLVVGVDGRAEIRTLDYTHGSWSRTERSCVNDTVAEWAFPGGEQSYEVDLRMRKNSRRHRGA